MYKYITNPRTKRKVSINGNLGRSILYKYLKNLKGGNKIFSNILDASQTWVVEPVSRAADAVTKVITNRASAIKDTSKKIKKLAQAKIPILSDDEEKKIVFDPETLPEIDRTSEVTEIEKEMGQFD